MAKIVLIGAGSRVFASRLVTDVLSLPELRDSTVTLMDIAAGPLEATAAYARKLVQQNGFNTRIEVTTDRRKALDGADYVFVAIMVGGGQLGMIDRQITLQHGLDSGDHCGGNGSQTNHHDTQFARRGRYLVFSSHCLS